ncbi:TadE family protein [Nocardioides coralli]|uniref:TadE family protein n=1 Tax=Nocardioides coralli TaxID=2872154 RepID=UPI001CA3A293|nr:TadE family protein [Nocardioides coralli]QZY28122.1 pilus assembly protein [Nocardioides coralli]
MARRRRGTRGAAAVELALVIPILFLIVGGVVDLGLAIALRAQMEEAAQEGAAIAARNPTQPSLARQRAKEVVTLTNLANSDIKITCPAGPGPRVTISHTSPTILLGAFFSQPFAIETKMTSGRLSSGTCTELTS